MNIIINLEIVLKKVSLSTLKFIITRNDCILLLTTKRHMRLNVLADFLENSVR